METPIENRIIEIEERTLIQLNKTRKWAMFLAIIGFIFLGLIIVMGLVAGTFFNTFSSVSADRGMPGYLVFLPVIGVTIIYFFPVLFLFRFSKHSALAVATYDKMELHKAVKNLKYYFAYLGTLIIIVFLVYFSVLIIAGSSVAFLKGL
jgi:uncharacterized BrkB/YihY/UPF0761 family membrane protein